MNCRTIALDNEFHIILWDLLGEPFATCARMLSDEGYLLQAIDETVSDREAMLDLHVGIVTSLEQGVPQAAIEAINHDDRARLNVLGIQMAPIMPPDLLPVSVVAERLYFPSILLD